MEFQFVDSEYDIMDPNICNISDGYRGQQTFSTWKTQLVPSFKGGLVCRTGRLEGPGFTAELNSKLSLGLKGLGETKELILGSEEEGFPEEGLSLFLFF